MELNETDLRNILAYISMLDAEVGLSDETKDDIERCVSEYRYRLSQKTNEQKD